MPNKNLILRVMLTAAFAGFLLWRVDLAELWREVRAADYLWVPPAIAVFLLSKLLVAVRWRLMMSRFGRVPVAHLFGALTISNLANLMLPARIGTLVRMMVPAQRHGVGRSQNAGIVFGSEPLLEGLAFAGIGLLGLALIDVEGFPAFAFWLLVAGVTIAILLAIPFARLRPDEGWTERGVLGMLPARARSFAEEQLPRFIEGFAVFRFWKIAVPSIALSFAIWMLEVVMFLLLGQAFHVSLGLSSWMLIMVAANVVTAFPVTPSNVGAYEVVITELLIALGVASGTAGGYAIVTHVMTIMTLAAAGLTAMWLMHLGFDDLFSMQQDHEDEERRGVGARAAEHG